MYGSLSLSLSLLSLRASRWVEGGLGVELVTDGVSRYSTLRYLGWHLR